MGTADNSEHVPDDKMYVVGRDVHADIAMHGNAYVAGTHEALDGLLRFVERAQGGIDVRAPHGPGTGANWLVRVIFRPLGSSREQIIRGEDATFDGACLLCRGLLAHALASGTVEL